MLGVMPTENKSNYTHSTTTTTSNFEEFTVAGHLVQLPLNM